MSHVLRDENAVAPAVDRPPLTVTRPALPPLSELIPHLEAIWESRSVSNFGPYHVRLEAALTSYLGVPHVSLIANATLGLMLAIRQLGLTGEVITTPFSFVATAHALAWTGITPVFVDIDPETLNLDPKQIERAITDKTTGILAVHCFGTPCDLDAIDAIASARNLKVIYDAAHAFGVRTNQASVLRRGDLSVLSFHATKVFNTFEGGAIVSPNEEMKLALDRMTNFGIVDDGRVESIGINAKMNEFSAALGLLQLEHVDAYLAARRRLDERYRELLDGVDGIRCFDVPANVERNYYAFPVLVESNHPLGRDALLAKLRHHGVYARRYFDPLISAFPMYRELPSARPGQLPNAESIAARILCLPLFPDLRPDQQVEIVQLLRS